MRWTVVRKLLAALAIFGMLASGIGLASYVIFNSPDQQASAPVRTPPKPPPPRMKFPLFFMSVPPPPLVTSRSICDVLRP